MENLTWQNCDEMSNTELLTEQEVLDVSGGRCSATSIIASEIEKAIEQKLWKEAYLAALRRFRSRGPMNYR